MFYANTLKNVQKFSHSNMLTYSSCTCVMTQIHYCSCRLTTVPSFSLIFDFALRVKSGRSFQHVLVLKLIINATHKRCLTVSSEIDMAESTVST